MSKVSDPTANKGSGFIWGVGVLVVIVAVLLGYIVLSSKGAKEEEIAGTASNVSMTVSVDNDGIVTLATTNPRAGAKVVDLYEDFSCIHCAELAEGGDEHMKAAVEDGTMVVHIHPLNFLDLRGEQLDAYLRDTNIQLDGHSTKSISALNVLAKSGDAYAYWNLRDYLFKNQQRLADWGFEDFAQGAKAFKAADADVNEIAKSNVDAGNSIGRLSAQRLKDNSGEVSSPRLFVDGKEIENQSGKPLNQWNWVSQVMEQ